MISPSLKKENKIIVHATHVGCPPNQGMAVIFYPSDLHKQISQIAQAQVKEPKVSLLLCKSFVKSELLSLTVLMD